MSPRPQGMRIRMATPDDSGVLLALKHALDAETNFMLLEPGERREEAEQIADELQHMVLAREFDSDPR